MCCCGIGTGRLHRTDVMLLRPKRDRVLLIAYLQQQLHMPEDCVTHLAPGWTRSAGDRGRRAEGGRTPPCGPLLQACVTWASATARCSASSPTYARAAQLVMPDVPMIFDGVSPIRCACAWWIRLQRPGRNATGYMHLLGADETEARCCSCCMTPTPS
jgi:hypothetical protein